MQAAADPAPARRRRPPARASPGGRAGIGPATRTGRGHACEVAPAFIAFRQSAALIGSRAPPEQPLGAEGQHPHEHENMNTMPYVGA